MLYWFVCRLVQRLAADRLQGLVPKVVVFMWVGDFSAHAWRRGQARAYVAVHAVLLVHRHDGMIWPLLLARVTAVLHPVHFRP
jgi:hypothetical protein